MLVMRFRLKQVTVSILFVLAFVTQLLPHIYRWKTTYDEYTYRANGYISDSWVKTCEFDHSGNVQICGREFSILKNVIVFNQRNFNGAPLRFELACDSLPDVKFSGIYYNHLNQWYEQVKCVDGTNYKKDSINGQSTTIIVQRYEYANLYHSMTDFYNAFLLVKSLGLLPNETSIFIWDQHAKGLLDGVWDVLFDKVIWMADAERRLFSAQLVWNIIGYNSPLSTFSLPSVPYIEEFREFVLSQYGAPLAHRKSCENLSIMFVWRHNYVAHPNNPKGIIHRKIWNEEDIILAVKHSFPTFKVNGWQLDTLDMAMQLGLIATTDILIGVHGAALTHSLFLPRHAGLIEIFPYAYQLSNLLHFKSIAKWRQLSYMAWTNPDRDNEFQDFHTKIEPNTIISLVTEMTKKLCAH